MKKWFSLFILIITTGLYAAAQDSDAMKKHYLKMYNQALQYNDVNAAINALHGYIAGDDNLFYKDTLSMLYFSNKSYYSALLLAEEVYKKNPANIAAMARAGECYDELGDPKTAITLFEQVSPKTKNPYHYYKLALSQYQLKRTAESQSTARIVIADTNSNKVGVSFQMGDGTQQLVPVNAAASNLLGVMEMEAKNYEAAKVHFKQALAFFPQFAGAQQNLKVTEDNTKKPVKTPVKTSGTKPKG
jgi:tetratricopeptide (TPR) repeat protein